MEISRLVEQMTEDRVADGISTAKAVAECSGGREPADSMAREGEAAQRRTMNRRIECL